MNQISANICCKILFNLVQIHHYIISTLITQHQEAIEAGHQGNYTEQLTKNVRKFHQILVCTELFISTSCLGNELNMCILCWNNFLQQFLLTEGEIPVSTCFLSLCHYPTLQCYVYIAIGRRRSSPLL